MAKVIDQHRAFVEALYQRAIKGSIEWKPSNSGTIDANIGNSIIELSKELDYNDQPSIRLEIKNTAGEVVDSFDDNYFSGLKPVHVSFSTYWELLSELYTLANRAARGADQILEELLLELEAKPVIDPPDPEYKRSSFADDLDDGVPF